MPTYEYKCTDNGEVFELWQEVGAEAPPCPTCGAPSKKVFHPTRTIFKGSGFYITDTRAESTASSGKSADKSESSETKSESATESKTEAKTEAKTDAAPAKAESKSP
jgi:putative FmdB family regulatory protein